MTSFQIPVSGKTDQWLMESRIASNSNEVQAESAIATKLYTE